VFDLCSAVPEFTALWDWAGKRGIVQQIH
jgi:hypothetical protein